MKTIILVIVALTLLILGGLGGWWMSTINQASPIVEHRPKRTRPPTIGAVDVPTSTKPMVTAAGVVEPMRPAVTRVISAPLVDLISRIAGPLADQIVPRAIERNRFNDARQIARDDIELRGWKDQVEAALASDHPENRATRAYSQIGLHEQDIGRLSLSELGSYNRAVKQANDLILPTIEHDAATTDQERRELSSIVRHAIGQFLKRSYITPDDAASEAVILLLDSMADPGEDLKLQPLRAAAWDAFQNYTDAVDELRKISPGPSVAAQERGRETVAERWKTYGAALRAYIEIRLSLFLRQRWATGP